MVPVRSDASAAESVALVPDQTVDRIARAALLAAVTGAFSYVSFPMVLSPAPVTLQVLGVFLAGIMLGPAWGPVAMVLYLLAGAVGVPVFSGGTAGIGQLFGPTGGYLFSFPIAAFVIGAVVHRQWRPWPPREIPLRWLLAGLVAGVVVVYTGGIVGMMVIMDMGLRNAIVVGALVFLPAEAAKIVAAIGIVRSDALVAR